MTALQLTDAAHAVRTDFRDVTDLTHQTDTTHPIDPAHDTDTDTLPLPGLGDERSAGAPQAPGAVSPSDARLLSKELFVRLRTLEEGTAEYSYVRGTLIEMNLTLAKFAAGRFRRRSEPMEDILQVATIGLIKAIDRFDPERPVEFSTFALPTIIGEIKRFFRDTSWKVHVPRRLQELRLALAKASDALEQELDRSPTVAELASRLGLTDEEVIEGLSASNAYETRSLDAPADTEDAESTLTRKLAVEESGFDATLNHESLKPLIASLAPRDRAILAMRFGEELTQSEIGQRLGLSQMHVSRLLTRILGRLRAGLLVEE
ncbi:SigB/SigF/SigG family RNA polymerase sigma factor [Kitasatospora sp. NBC_00315]|uniref:SigB/SigF/SigG family RNA polymerase sigma factor n=1 Tax=Kitasatospora sp. NBC_00315 TaxID=2975963 RepID=UPI0032523F8C